ncbi:MAG: hypothetical protein HW384_1234 [Dehalococcoidia bacterium]|nr:hypothetical protein [Dehalococcoidia bacterium]
MVPASSWERRAMMLGRFKSMQSEKGFTLLTLAMGLGIVAVLGGAITIATIQVFRGASYNQVALAPSAGQFKQVGGKIGTARVQIEEHPYSVVALFSKYAIISTNGDVTVGGNAQVTSNPFITTIGGIYAKGNVVVKNSAAVASEVNATGSITLQNQGTITGVQRHGAEVPVLVFQTDAEITTLANGYKAEAQAIGTLPLDHGDYKINGTQNLGGYIPGDLSITGNANITLTGTVYVTGQIKVTGNPSVVFVGPGTIVAVGDIDLRGKSGITPDPDDIPLIMSVNGDITLGGSSGVLGAPGVLYAARGDIDLKGNSTLYGAAMARNIQSGGSSVIYPFATIIP